MGQAEEGRSTLGGHNLLDLSPMLNFWGKHKFGPPKSSMWGSLHRPGAMANESDLALVPTGQNIDLSLV